MGGRIADGSVSNTKYASLADFTSTLARHDRDCGHGATEDEFWPEIRHKAVQAESSQQRAQPAAEIDPRAQWREGDGLFSHHRF